MRARTMDRDKKNGGGTMTRFSDWLTERNLLVLILGVVFVTAVERLSARIHDDMIAPTFQHCARIAGLAPKDGQLARTRRERVLLHVLQFLCTLGVIYMVSRLLGSRLGAPKGVVPTPSTPNPSHGAGLKTVS
jgi:hypothetical protein